jgi:hypothetical protein
MYERFGSGGETVDVRFNRSWYDRHECSVEEGIDDAAGSHEDRGITTKVLPCLEEVQARNTVNVEVTRSRHEGKRCLDHLKENELRKPQRRQPQQSPVQRIQLNRLVQKGSSFYLAHKCPKARCHSAARADE